MSGAPETKYSDRDVRENEDLTDLAIDYVQAYKGDFDYLIDMKLRLASGYSLTTPMIRGILNCMRHDPRVGEMPPPLPKDEVVVSIDRPRKRSRRGEKQCDNPDGHYFHHWYPDDKTVYSCEGVEWAINRDYPTFGKTRIKLPFCIARTGSLIHMVAPGWSSWISWPTQVHGWGWHEDSPRALHAKLVCKYPSVIQNPVLLTEGETQDYFKVGYQLCPHCRSTGGSVPESVLPKEKRDQILEILSDDDGDDGYGHEYATAENAVAKAEPQVQQWLFVNPDMSAEDIAEKINDTSEFWE